MIDVITLRQQVVEIHRTHDRTNVGHGQVENGVFQFIDLVGSLGGIEHLEECHAIDLDHGVVAGDDLLAGNLQHPLHHVHLRTNPLHERDDDTEAGS